MRISTISIGVILLIAIATIQAASAQVDGALSLANLAVEPNPVVAGQNVSIVFRLYNSYDNSLKNINMQLQGSYPLLNFSPTGTYEIATMGEGLSSGYYSYELHVPSTAQEGVYTLEIVATYETASSPMGIGEAIGSSEMPISLYVYNTPNITINAVPSAVNPGSTAGVSLLVINSGEGTARNVNINLLSGNGLNVSGANKISIGMLQPGQQVPEQAYYFASQDLTAGQHTLRFAITYTTDTNQTVSKIVNATISVLVNSPQIKVSAASAMPQTLYTGSNQTLTLLVQNTGTGYAKNISVQIEPGIGTQVVSSPAQYFFAELAPSTSVQIPVLVSANANASSASILASAQYYSANYAYKYDSNSTIQLRLAPSAQFKVTSESSEMQPGSTDVPLTFSVVNTGNEQAQEIQFSLQSIYPITPVASTYYLQSLMPGQSANITFLVSADSQAIPGNYPVTIYEQWKQPNGAINQVYSGTTNYFAQVKQQQSGNGWAYAAVAIVVVIAIAYAVAARSRKSKKTKEKARQ